MATGTQRVTRTLLLAAAGLLLMAMIIMSGVLPLTASSGHWRVTAFVLDLAKRRSVDTHSFFITAPPLDDAALVVKGAGHYESGCASCHGSPAAPRPRVVMSMTPHPPFLPERIRRWLPRELFYIVKHGIKFTGMPAWPSHSRDDEVWAMVAFLRQLPALDAAGYRALAFGEAARPVDSLLSDARTEAPDATIERCDRCHGPDGLGRTVAAYPRLAGQKAEFMALALRAYARQQRRSGMMGPIAAGLDEVTIERVAAYYATRPPSSDQQELDEEAVTRGAAIVSAGIPARDIPACRSCHDDGASGHNPAYPRLAGQFAEFLRLQLQLFAEGRRGGSEYAGIMQPIAARLTEAERRDVAAYFAASGR
jgi:cytochrome c553